MPPSPTWATARRYRSPSCQRTTNTPPSPARTVPREQPSHRNATPSRPQIAAPPSPARASPAAPTVARPRDGVPAGHRHAERAGLGDLPVAGHTDVDAAWHRQAVVAQEPTRIPGRAVENDVAAPEFNQPVPLDEVVRLDFEDDPA